jgi:hypothetical protein
VIPGLSFTFASTAGTEVSMGSLTISKARNLSKIPFSVTVKVASGTGLLSGASGSYTLQGFFNAASGNAVSAKLRGAITTPTS